MLQAMAAMLARDAMQEKLRSELGSAHPWRAAAALPGRQYEAWRPAAAWCMWRRPTCSRPPPWAWSKG